MSHRNVVDAHTVARAIAHAPRRTVRLVDARPNRHAYLAGHLADAVHADLDTQLAQPTASPENGGRHPLPSLDAWLAQLGAWGIGPGTQVFVYDDQGGANAAARCWWMLHAVGHEAVAVIDGGLRSAMAAGLELTTAETRTESSAIAKVSTWKLPMATIDVVDARRKDREWCILDVRAEERFIGARELIDPCAGHIPGAVNLPFTKNLAADGQFLSRDQLREQYQRVLGGVPAERLVVHCGSGVTACHTLLALDRAGLPGAQLYVGSWSEWCRSDRPREPTPK